MEISLIRHGRSVIQHAHALSYAEFLQWLNHYDLSGVIFEKRIPPNTQRKTKHADVIITSTLKRSIESAKYLNPNATLLNSSLFDEVNIPLPKKQFKGMTLSPMSWIMFLGIYLVTESHHLNKSIINERTRAKKAAEFLHRLTQEHPSVVVVGHGIFNLFIGEELNRIGWKTNSTQKSDYWSCTTYHLT